MLVTVVGGRLRGEDARKGADVLAEGGGKAIIWRRQDTVLEI